MLWTNFISNIIDEYGKIYTYSPSIHQDIYQKLIKGFSNHIPIHIIPNILNEEVIDLVIDEVVNKKDSEKSDTEKETFESIEELKIPREYDDVGNFIIDDLNEK